MKYAIRLSYVNTVTRLSYVMTEQLFVDEICDTS